MHPRFKYYPFHKDYTALGNEFRPFVMFTHVANYASESVNTDQLGFRVQYDNQDNLIDITKLKEQYQACNLMLGNSTLFGVDTSSDKKVIAHYLQQPDVPCIHLSIRGGTTQQELAMFLLMKQYLPKVKNIIFFTGITNPSLAALDDALPHHEFGGVFSEPYHFQTYRQMYAPLVDGTYHLRKRFYDYIEQAYHKAGKFKKKFFHGLMRTFQIKESSPPPSSQTVSLEFDAKMQILQQHLANDFETWQALREQMGFKLHFILQPSIGWTKKNLTPAESECYNTDFKKHKIYYQRFVSQDVYQQYSSFLRTLMVQYQVDYYDANVWLNDEKFAHTTCFTDVCHLNDEGCRIMGEFIQQKLQMV